MKQENYVIGLDLGVNNVGWSIVNLDQKKIEKCGVRLFNPSDDAKNRRGARSVRRRLRRQRNRVNDALKLFRSIGFDEQPCVDTKLLSKRIKGLNERISKQDIVNIIKYFMSHRGYISFDDEEVNFVDLKGEYPCVYYQQLLNDKGKIRAQNETVKTIDLKRELTDILNNQLKYYPELNKINDDLINIFCRKREFWEGPGSETSLTPFGRFKSENDVIDYQQNKKINPSYEKYLFEELIGKCNVLYLNEKCAPISNIYAQQFNLINDFTNITFTDINDTLNISLFREVENGYKLSDIGLQAIIDYCFNCDFNLKIDKMFKELFNLSTNNATGYRQNKNKKIEMSTLDAYRSIMRVVKKYGYVKPEWLNDFQLYNILMYYINVVPSSIMLVDMLSKDKRFKQYVNNESVDLIKKIYGVIKTKYSGYHSLSEKALIKSINDMLATGLNYQQVRKKFNYDKAFKEECAKSYISANGKVKLSNKFIDDLIASPQVKKTLRQAIKVINAIMDEKKAIPYCISIESEKEVNGKDRIKEINAEQKIQEGLRKKAIGLIETNGYKVSEQLITKVMLYEEINGYCPYCNTQQISLKDVLDSRIQIEHILPLSQSADDSYNNKTLSCIVCNQAKKNKTPYDWKKSGDYDDFKSRIINNKNFSDAKKANFLFEEDLDKYSIRFINRNLRDTAYATKELVNQIKMFNYYLDDKYDKTIKTLSTPGQITHKIRENYNLVKDRDIGKFHHAVDASIVASIADTNIGKVIINSQNNDKYWINDKTYRIDNDKKVSLANYLKSVKLDAYFDDIKNIDSDDKIYISSQVIKSAQGQLSDANISKFINIDNKLYKVSQINNIYEEDTKQLEEYFEDDSKKVHLMIRDNNPQLYNKLKAIFNEYKDKKGNPFKNYCFDRNSCDDFQELKDFNYLKHGIRASDNPKSPMVLKLRYYSTINNPYFINKISINKKDNTLLGLDSLKQYCTEIYYDIDHNKFAFLPVYSVSVDLNNKRINKEDAYYKKLKDIYLKNANVKYITVVFNGNYMEIIKSNGIVVNGIYQYFHKTNNKLLLKNGNALTSSDKSFTIYDVDILGNRKERLTYSIK